MALSFDPRFFVAFLLVSTRCAAFFLLAPPFRGSVPAKIRVGLAVSMGLLLAPSLANEPKLPIDNFGHLLAGVLFQTGIGIALGLLVYVTFQAVHAAGAAIDMLGGLTASQMFDPFTQAAEGPMTRLYLMLATVIVFISGGHLMLIAGLARSFQAAPLSGFSVNRLDILLIDGLSNLVLSALQIGAPLLGALFVADVVMGLANRAAPQLNVMIMSFGVKGLIIVALGGIALPLLATSTVTLMETALKLMWQFVR